MKNYTCKVYKLLVGNKTQSHDVSTIEIYLTAYQLQRPRLIDG